MSGRYGAHAALDPNGLTDHGFDTLAHRSPAAEPKDRSYTWKAFSEELSFRMLATKLIGVSKWT